MDSLATIFVSVAHAVSLFFTFAFNPPPMVPQAALPQQQVERTVTDASTSGPRVYEDTPQSPASTTIDVVTPAAPPLPIQGVEGPKTVFVGIEATWDVAAKGARDYGVVWADGSAHAPLKGDERAPLGDFSDNSSFTHTFTKPGTFNVRFFARKGASMGTTTIAVRAKTSPYPYGMDPHLMGYEDGSDDVADAPVAPAAPVTVTVSTSTPATTTPSAPAPAPAPTPAPSAPVSLAISTDFGASPLPVIATVSRGNNCPSYRIDWGDGSSDTRDGGASPICERDTASVQVSHLYVGEGTYRIVLTSGSQTKTEAVYVSKSPPVSFSFTGPVRGAEYAVGASLPISWTASVSGGVDTDPYQVSFNLVPAGVTDNQQYAYSTEWGPLSSGSTTWLIPPGSAGRYQLYAEIIYVEESGAQRVRKILSDPFTITP